MSSEVQKMWTISATSGSAVASPGTAGAASRRRLSRYSTALTSWRVTASISASSATSVAPKPRTTPRR